MNPISDRLENVRGRIADAAHRAGRDPTSVCLVGVTKYVEPTFAEQLHAAGLADLGESRPQELWRKAEMLPKSIRWHFIGHLQRNKVARTIELAHLIHSVDSLRLLKEIDRCAKSPTHVLLEVNMSREAAKSGFAPNDVCAIGDELKNLAYVQVIGLMTMAANQDAESCRSTFVELRTLRDRLGKGWGMALPELSMGMTNDFEVAIEEGATIVRLGSCLTEGIS